MPDHVEQSTSSDVVDKQFSWNLLERFIPNNSTSDTSAESKQLGIAAAAGSTVGIILGAYLGYDRGFREIKADKTLTPRQAGYRLLQRVYGGAAVRGLQFGLASASFSFVQHGLNLYRGTTNPLHMTAAGVVASTPFVIPALFQRPKAAAGLLLTGLGAGVVGGALEWVYSLLPEDKASASPSPSTDTSKNS
mmetsp:Transcript_21563/g.37019  ORF Transcript_21563/g.37019 Transcript_21563/m.37019 type:complete len:192 (+) Transcript_21563:94-669(+)